MNTFDLMNIAFTALERRRESKPSPAVANCDVCDERPGERMAKAAGGVDTWICEQCDEEEHARMLGRKVIQFRTRDDRDAYEAGSRTHGEI